MASQIRVGSIPSGTARLAYITNNAIRNATMRKRRLGLFKKVHELSVLCDVPACAVVYAPQEAQPGVWPSPEEARVLLDRFNSLEGFGKSNNMMNQEKILGKRLENLQAQLGRVLTENTELAGEGLYLQCLAGRPVSELNCFELGWISRVLARRTEAVQARILQLSEDPGEGAQPPSLPPLIPPPETPPPVEEGVKTDGEPAVEAAQNQCDSMSFGGSGSETEPARCDLLEIGGFGMWSDILGSASEQEIFPASDDFFLPNLDDFDFDFGTD